MPDNIESQTPAVTPPAEPTPQQASRAAVYEQLYGPSATPPAQTVDSVPTTPTPAAPPVDYKAQYEALAASVEQMRSAFQQSQQPPAAPPATPGPDWFDHLQRGQRTEAERMIVDKVAAEASQKITKDTLSQAVELMRTERDIEMFNDSTRANNSDLLDVEDLVSLKAEQYFKNASAPKNTKEFIETYKTSVNKAVDDMRKVLQRTRAVAKNEAMTVQRDILNASTVVPNQITPRDQPAGEPNTTPDISPQSYMEMRKANSAARQNPYASDTRRVVGL